MQRIGPDQYCTCLSVRNCWFKETRRRRWSRSQYGIFCPDETRKFTFRLFIIYLHFTTPSLVFSLLFQGFKRPIASYFTRLKTLAVSKCPPAGRIEWQTSVLVNEVWFVEHVKSSLLPAKSRESDCLRCRPLVTSLWMIRILTRNWKPSKVS